MRLTELKQIGAGKNFNNGLEECRNLYTKLERYLVIFNNYKYNYMYGVAPAKHRGKLYFRFDLISIASETSRLFHRPGTEVGTHLIKKLKSRMFFFSF